MTFEIVITVLMVGTLEPQIFKAPEYKYKTQADCENHLVAVTQDFLWFMKSHVKDKAYDFTAMCKPIDVET